MTNWLKILDKNYIKEYTNYIDIPTKNISIISNLIENGKYQNIIIYKTNIDDYLICSNYIKPLKNINFYKSNLLNEIYLDFGFDKLFKIKTNNITRNNFLKFKTFNLNIFLDKHLKKIITSYPNNKEYVFQENKYTNLLNFLERIPNNYSEKIIFQIVNNCKFDKFFNKYQGYKFDNINEIFIFTKFIYYKDLDNIFLSLDGDIKNEKRIISYLMEQSKNIYYNYKKDVYNKWLEELKIDNIDQEIIDNVFITKKKVNGDVLIPITKFNYENNIKNYIEKLLSQDNIVKLDNFKIDIPLNDKQKSVIEMVNNNNISICTGLPGTGKSTCLKYIFLNYFNYSGNTFVLSFTGTSVKRIQSEFSSEIHLNNIRTIHSFLNSNFNLDILIIDECSMVYLKLLNNILIKYPNIKKIILFGDPDQLPSIKGDCMFSNIINFNYKQKSLIPNIYLNKIMRTDKLNLLNLFKMVKDGKIDYNIFNNTNDIILHDITNYKDILKKYILENQIENLFIMTPYRCKNIINSDNINNYIKSFCNKNTDTIYKNISIGDIIIANKNITLGNQSKIYNGTRYKVLSCDAGEYVREYKSNFNTSSIEMIIKLQELNTETIVEALYQDLEHFTLGYITSIHKAQGKENDICIVILPSYQSNNFETKNILYTAITRAKKQCIILSNKRILDNYIKNNMEIVKSFLSISKLNM